MAVPVASPQSIWLPVDAAGFPRSISPPLSRGNSLGGDCLAPGLQPMVVAGQRSNLIGQRSISPSPSVATLSRAIGLATNSSAASSLEAPTLSFRPAVASTGSAAPLTATRKVLSSESSLKLKDAQVWFDGQRAPLSTLVQDTVTQQFLKMKESMNQEVQRCVQMLTSKSNVCEDLLQRLEAERSIRESTLVGLRHDFDRQQSQITEIVQSRLSTSAVQDLAIRERDGELSSIVENMRQDMEAIRTQNRNSLAGNAATSEQQQKVEKAYLELRRDFEAMTSDNQRYRSAHTKMEKAMKKILDGSDSTQLLDLAQQVGTQREHQQQVERVLLELRKDLQGATDELNGITAGRKFQEERAGEQQKTIQEQQKLLTELRNSVQAAGEKIVEVGSGISELRSSAEVAGEAALSDLRKQVEAILTMKREQQMLSASFGADLLARVERLEESIRKSSTLSDRLQRDIETTVLQIQELTKTVNTEKASRIDLTRSLDGYRSSYLQTSSELRDGVLTLQERVALLESVQLEDRGLREKTMEQMEVNLQELMSVTQLEREARLQSDRDSARRREELAELQRQLHVESASRVDLGQSLEAFRTAHLQSASDMRKEIDGLSQESVIVRGFVDSFCQDTAKTVQEQSDARIDFSRVFDLHRARSEEMVARIARMEEASKETQQLLTQDSETRESLRIDYLSTRSELGAEVELVMDKLGSLESKVPVLELAFEDSDARNCRAVETLERGIAELRNLIVDGMGSETMALRGGLENMSNNLQTAVVDLEVERSRRAQEASTLQNEVQVLRSQLSQLEAASVSRENNAVDVRSTVVEVTAPAIENLKESVSRNLNVVSRDLTAAVEGQKADVEVQKAAMAKQTSELQTGMRAMQEKLVGLETAASEDRGWRQQAVQDLEGILGEIKHITPTAASTRALPTLASALRLCKTDQR